MPFYTRDPSPEACRAGFLEIYYFIPGLHIRSASSLFLTQDLVVFRLYFWPKWQSLQKGNFILKHFPTVFVAKKKKKKKIPLLGTRRIASIMVLNQVAGDHEFLSFWWLQLPRNDINFKEFELSLGKIWKSLYHCGHPAVEWHHNEREIGINLILFLISGTFGTPHVIPLKGIRHGNYQSAFI